MLLEKNYHNIIVFLVLYLVNVVCILIVYAICDFIGKVVAKAIMKIIKNFNVD